MAVFRANHTVLGKFVNPFSFELASNCKTAVYGPLKTELLDIISGKLPDPAKTVTYPAFGAELWPTQAIQLVKFGQGSSTSKAPFVGARYESFRDEFDYTLLDVLNRGKPAGLSAAKFNEIINSFDLADLLSMWCVGLSNGQSRRAQIAVALMRQPKLLIVDEPFLGLDALNSAKLSAYFANLDLPLVIGLKDGELAPRFINQKLYAGKTVYTGNDAESEIARSLAAVNKFRKTKNSRAKPEFTNPSIEIKNLTIKFADAAKPILDNLSLCIYDGERVRITGPNGSGKSTLLSVITADHPKSWTEKVVLHGEPRTVGKHSYFGINAGIGASSPEVHAIFPNRFNIIEAISTGFNTNFVPVRDLSIDQQKEIEFLTTELGLDINSKTRFGDMDTGTQKLVLFARALVKKPRILILDEAFSAVDQTQLERAFKLLDAYTGATLLVSHVEDELPAYDRTISLA